MKKLISACLILIATHAQAQSTLNILVKDSSSGEAIQGVSVILKGTGKAGISDMNGRVIIHNIPNGQREVIFSSIGYSEKKLILVFPIPSSDSLTSVLMAQSRITESEVIVTSSRTDSRIENTPTRVEVLGTEEVAEESGIKPSHIASLLGDVAGIQAQQTSAVSGNTDMRIQGLPGDYTQILRDGMPLFGGYAGSFSLLQIPPLDLKQIEIVKGASSTLYGGGAIAGMINIISKRPKKGVPERTFLINQSTLKETNADLFLSGRDEKSGYTFFAGGTGQGAVDVNKDGLSDVPFIQSFFFHPTLFLYPNEKNSVSIGLNGSVEERKGGDMDVLKGKPTGLHSFFIRNLSYRTTLDGSWEDKISANEKFTLKAVVSKLNRSISTNTNDLKADQTSFYTEASWVKKSKSNDLVSGINISGEKFRKRSPASNPLENYHYTTTGFFIQDDWRIHPKFTMESGFRADAHNKYGNFLLPRVSLLYKISPSFTSRLGAGLGYKIPTVFENDIDERNYVYLQPLKDVKAERSSGVNWDINFKTKLGDNADLAVNQSFYITRISSPLLHNFSNNQITFSNASAPLLTKGFETWAQLTIGKFEAYLGYTLTNARKEYDHNQPFLELSAKNKFASVIGYEFSKHFRAILEGAYTGNQYLDGGTKSPGFPFIASMLRYDTGHFSFVLNCENLLDYRQTRKGSTWTGSISDPVFKQIWAPIDGRVVNLSIKIGF